MAVTTTIPPGARSSSPCSAASGPPPPTRCCDSGRPLYTDPTTGQTICSCQHEQMLNYQRIAQASLIGPGGLPLPMYNSPYAEGLPAYLPGAEQSHFYPNLVSRKAPNWSPPKRVRIAENPKHMSHLILFCSLSAGTAETSKSGCFTFTRKSVRSLVARKVKHFATNVDVYRQIGCCQQCCEV